MTESTVPHEDNDTPDASADDVKTAYADTPGAPEGAAVEDQGVKLDSDENDDPKSGGTPAHAAPTEDSPQS